MTPKEKSICQRALDGMIQQALGGPSGDPDPTHMRLAVMAFKTMKKLKLNIDNTPAEFIDDGYDYMKDIDFDGRYLPEPKLTKGEKKAIRAKWKNNPNIKLVR